MRRSSERVQFQSHEPETKPNYIDLGKYLGNGAFGCVHQAEWNNESVAVKMLRKGRKEDEKYFKTEVKQLKRVKHSNIISLMGTGSDEEFQYIVLEYAEGGCLRKLVHSSEDYSIRQALEWARQIADGVAYLHGLKLLHRDLKPDNILLKQTFNGCKNPTPSVMICDFGTVAELKTKMTKEKGTLCYMAPEVLKAEPYNEKCDVYSLAILVWETLERRKPFDHYDSDFALFKKVGIDNERPKLSVDWLEPVQQLIQTCWDLEVSRRPAMQNVVEKIQQLVISDAGNYLIPARPKKKAEDGNEETTARAVQTISFHEIKFKEQIGEDRFGVVFRAEWNNTQVAVKQNYDDENNYYQREVKHLSRVDHPNIIKLIGISNDDRFRYLILEFAECGSLKTMLHGEAQREYKVGHALSWTKQCAEAAAYLHKLNLLHRELKPANILLTDNGRKVKLGDFGTVTELQTRMTGEQGTMRYMAPEVFEGSKYSMKCDVFSLGIVIWEILSRKKPFEYDNRYRIMYEIMRGKRPFIPCHWPNSIKDLISSCWNANPNDRPTMQNVVEQLNELMPLYPGSDIPIEFE